MKPTLVSYDDVIEAMTREIDRLGSQAAFGKRCGVSGPFINMVLSRVKDPSDKILKRLGFKRVKVAQYFKLREG